MQIVPGLVAALGGKMAIAFWGEYGGTRVEIGRSPLDRVVLGRFLRQNPERASFLGGAIAGDSPGIPRGEGLRP